MVADGVVVASTDVGTVTAYDARSGAELWDVALGHPLAGTPTVADGRLLLTEAGTGMELTDRDHRVLALDLATGAFLGAWHPGSMPFPATGLPLTAGPAGGPVLVPGTSGVNLVEAVR